MSTAPPEVQSAENNDPATEQLVVSVRERLANDRGPVALTYVYKHGDDIGSATVTCGFQKYGYPELGVILDPQLMESPVPAKFTQQGLDLLNGELRDFMGKSNDVLTQEQLQPGKTIVLRSDRCVLRVEPMTYEGFLTLAREKGDQDPVSEKDLYRSLFRIATLLYGNDDYAKQLLVVTHAYYGNYSQGHQLANFQEKRAAAHPWLH